MASKRRPIGWVSVQGVGAIQTSVTCTFTFEAAHHLDWHTGKCKNLHGHSYRLDVTVAGGLDANGVVVDFDILNSIVQREVIDHWDHRDLNEVLDNPTAELLAHRAWELLTGGGLAVSALRLWETPGSWVDLTVPESS
jgi:6-pyruvoyltetrahydropterin/6-carboxytetrahydropterin synthase